MHPIVAALVCAAFNGGAAAAAKPHLTLNDRGYFSMPGLDVMAFQDFYPEGHQGAVSIIQNGVRVASNGDLRLEPAPGQWAPVPVQKERLVDAKAGEVVTTLAYPDPDKDRKGFNPIEYPNLALTYRVRVRAEGAAVRVLVDLTEPLPAAWVGKVGFNLELFPATLFGRTFYASDPPLALAREGRGDGKPLSGAVRSGLFPRQPNGPVAVDADHQVQPEPLATGRRLVIAPETPAQRLTIESRREPLALLDGRVNHPNGWFIVRAKIPAGATAGAIDWLITPNALPGWRAPPVVHVSQVGYHPSQRKVAVIEVDAADRAPRRATLVRIGEDGRREPVLAAPAKPWPGTFLRYRYSHFDFSKVTREGVYEVESGPARTEPFRIAHDVWKRQVWQPTLGVFLPVQMCHMRVVEKYRVWHGACHLDDARMAPTSYNHFDGYKQGDSTLTKWRPGEVVPGMNVGGWHDAGDDDLRIESQAGEVYVLALAWETFGVKDDDTTVDEGRRLVEIREPDGKPDVLQQIAHGMLHVVGAWKALGRFPRGMIVPTLRQYRMVGDVAEQTDGAASSDDRLMFTEVNPARALVAAADVAAGARVLRGFDDGLAAEGLRAAEAVWRAEEGAGRAAGAGDKEVAARVHAAVELFLTTRKEEYRRAVIEAAPAIKKQIAALGWIVGRALPAIGDAGLTAVVREAVAAYAKEERAAAAKNPFGVPYKPVIWGAGWGIQEHGVKMYFLHAAFPDLVGTEGALAALDFVLGVHPGANTASFASGVGARSMTTAYGWNRADWSYVPGGVVSGTALIRPDFPELKDFPFLWQQGEYVLGGGATNFMVLALGVERMLEGTAGKQ
ncbi:MAG TPA: glycoside hydrolase family 9 protein [Polyangia bacterium]